MRICVIGSGAAALACLEVLKSHGLRATVVSAGVRTSLGAGTRDETDISEAPTVPSSRGVSLKPWFGSYEMYNTDARDGVRFAEGVAVRNALSWGGLTRSWGATVDFHLPADWPEHAWPQMIDRSVVEGLLRVGQTHFSDLSAEAGVAREANGKVLVGSTEAARSFRRIGSELSELGWFCRASSLAIETDVLSSHRCVPCGRCISGCPLDSIWFAGTHLERFCRSNGISVIDEFIVAKLEATPKGVAVLGHSGGRSETLNFDHVFLAAGAISTAAILLRSLGLRGAHLSDSHTLFGGAISPRGCSGSSESHALSQWWASGSDRKFTVQFYNPDERNEGRVPLAAVCPTWLRRETARRITPAIAYLDSSRSGKVLLRSDGRGISVSTSRGSVPPNGSIDELRALSRCARKAGYLLFPSFFRSPAPGTGFHFGKLEIGALRIWRGELGNWTNRVAAVDGAALPAVPVGSITAQIMMNSARITREWCENRFGERF